MKILMVCLGNICRSPLAEGIMLEKLKQHKIDFKVDSAGTGNWHSGEPPDRRSIAVGRKYGVDVSTQKARQITPDDFIEFDILFAMDAEVYSDLLRMAKPEQQNKIFSLLPFSGKASSAFVPDPYYGGAEQFEEVYHLLDEACEKAVKKLMTIQHK